MAVPNVEDVVVGTGEHSPPTGRPGPEPGTRGAPVECEVRCDSAGMPRELTHEGRDYTVISPPLRWYERRNWWELDGRVPRDSALNAVDRQRWSVQVARSGAVVPRTFELLHQESKGRWWVVHDRLG